MNKEIKIDESANLQAESIEARQNLDVLALFLFAFFLVFFIVFAAPLFSH